VDISGDIGPTRRESKMAILTKFKTIQIDFDLHKKIEMERSSFEETENDVLKRLLKIYNKPSEVEPVRGGWFGRGLSLPQDTEVRLKYNNKVYYGKIEKGQWVVEGRTFPNPTDASVVASTKKGKNTKLTGWKFWEVLPPGAKQWVRLSELK